MWFCDHSHCVNAPMSDMPMVTHPQSGVTVFEVQLVRVTVIMEVLRPRVIMTEVLRPRVVMRRC